jgi:alpha-tubulin suppressor-like RCC1 family protein
MLEDILIIKIFGGHYNCFAISNSSVIYGWGKNFFGLLGLNDKKNRNSPQELEFFKGKHVFNIVSGFYHSFFICKNGEIYSCGGNFKGQLGLGNDQDYYSTPQEVSNLKGKDIIELSSGSDHLLALSSFILFNLIFL